MKLINNLLRGILRREEVELKHVAIAGAVVAALIAGTFLGVNKTVEIVQRTAVATYPNAFASYTTGSVADCSYGCPSAASLKSAGYRGVMSYLSYDTGKNWSSARLTDVLSHGLAAGFNWESTGYTPLNGWAYGVSDAKQALVEENALGVNTPIYFSVDVDATEAQQCAIDNYFAGAASVLGASRVGAYGDWYVLWRDVANGCKGVMHTGSATYAWQTYAWSGAAYSSTDDLYQDQNGINLGGGQIDHDQVNDAWGAHLPDGTVLTHGTPSAPPPAPAPSPSPTPVTCSFGNSGWTANPWFNGDGNQSFTVYKYGGSVNCLNPQYSYGIQVWTGSYWANVCSPSLGTCWDGWTTRSSDYWALSYYTTPCNHLFRAMVAIRSGSGKVAGYKQVGSWKIVSDCA